MSREERGVRAWPALGLVLLLAVAVRALMLPYPHLDADMAMTGLMARHVLEGELPIFFWGQPYCGAIEAYLAAPIFALFGACRVTLCATVALVSLAFVVLAYAAARDMWGRRAGLLSMLLAALPPYYFLVHNILPRAAYIEVPTLSLLLGWLAWRLGRGRAPAWEYLVYGLAAGVGFWTHFLIAYALLGSALYLVLARWRVLREKGRLLMLAGFAVGSLPLWLYNFQEPFATFLYLTRPKFHVSAGEALLRLVQDGVPGVLAAWAGGRGAPGELWPFYAGARVLGLASLAWLLWQRRRGLASLARLNAGRADGSEVWLLMLLAALVVTTLSGESASYTLRHLVPVYAAVIPLGGYLLDRLWERRSRALALGLLAVIMACNLAGLYYAANVFHPRRAQRHLAEERMNQALAKKMLAHGVHHAFTWNYWDAYIFNFDVGEKVILDSPAHTHHPAYLRAILRDAKAGFVVRYDSRPYEAALKAAGAGFQRFEEGEFFCLYDLRLPEHGLAEVAKEGWRLEVRPHPALAGLAADGLVSAWSTRAPQRPGPFLKLDLGRVVEGLCLLRLLPGKAKRSPAAYVLETSRDGAAWSPALKVDGFRWSLTRASGRLIADYAAPRQDLYFPPRAARYLRLTLLGRRKLEPWSVAELSLYRRTAPGPRLEPARLAAAARRLGLRLVYADEVLAAHLPRGLTVSHLFCRAGADWPARLAPQSLLPAALEGVGIAVEAYQAPALEAALARQGLGWQRTEAGGYALYHGLNRPPLPQGLPPRVARARSSGKDEARAWDRDPATRWTTGRPRRAGDFLELTLERPLRLEGLVLDSGASPHDLPPGLVLELSPEGRSWRRVPANELSTGPLVFAGDRLLASRAGGRRVLRFPAQPVAALRLKARTNDPVYYFSLHELRLLPAAERP